MKLNQTLIKSMKETKIREFESCNSWDMLIKTIARIEGFINFNRNDNNSINRILSYILEFITTLIIFIYVIPIFYIVRNKYAYNNSMISSIAPFLILILVFISLNKKKDFNCISFLKLIAIIFLLTHKIIKERLLKEIVSIFFSVTLVAVSLYGIISTYFIRTENINLFDKMVICIAALSVVYFLKIELQNDGLRKLFIKGLFTSLNFIITILFAIISFKGYNMDDSLWIAKYVSLALLFIFQLAAIVNLFKEEYNYIIEYIESLTNIYLYNISVDKADEMKQISIVLSQLYIFTPNYEGQTLTDYFNIVMEEIKNIKHIFKREERK